MSDTNFGPSRDVLDDERCEHNRPLGLCAYPQCKLTDIDDDEPLGFLTEDDLVDDDEPLGFLTEDDLAALGYLTEDEL